MGKLRSLSTSIWSDPFIEELKPSEKLLFIYLITNDKTNMLGIYEVSIRKITFDTGLKKEDVVKALKEFERLKKVKYVNNFVILVNFLKHQNFNTNMKKSAIDVYNDLPNELKDSKLNIHKGNPSEGFESLCNHYGMVRKVEVEVEVEVEKKEKETKASVFNFRKELLSLGGDEQLVSDWLMVRKQKKATNTQTSLNMFLKQVDLSGKDLNFVLTWVNENTYARFKAEWLNKTNSFGVKKQNNQLNADGTFKMS